MTMDIEQTYQQGFQLRCDGRYSEAQQVLQRVLASNPGHVNAKHQLALIAGFLGDFDGSMASLQALANQNPANLEIRYDLAMTQMMLGYQDEACANFQHILRVNPNHENARRQAIYC
jgi:thioredoxin-like negative regulator of GroEL